MHFNKRFTFNFFFKLFFPFLFVHFFVFTIEHSCFLQLQSFFSGCYRRCNWIMLEGIPVSISLFLILHLLHNVAFFILRFFFVRLAEMSTLLHSPRIDWDSIWMRYWIGTICVHFSVPPFSKCVMTQRHSLSSTNHGEIFFLFLCLRFSSLFCHGTLMCNDYHTWFTYEKRRKEKKFYQKFLMK